MDDILKEMECEELIETFRNNHIDLDTFKLLNPEEIKELVPSIGLRKKLQLKIHQLMINDAVISIESENAPDVTSVESLPSTETLLSDDTTAFDDFLLLKNPPIDLFEKVSKPLLPDFDLRTLLQTSPLGSSILNYYDAHKQLDNTQRSRLVDIITKHLYTHIINYRLKGDDYILLAAKIISLFPTEATGTYYVSPIKKHQSRTGKSIAAKGRLVSKVSNLISICGEASPMRKRKAGQSSTDENVFKRPTPVQENLENHEDIVWLKHNTEPWDMVLEKWSATFAIRKNTERDAPGTVSDYVNRWPILKDLRSDVLINQDFDALYPGCGLKFYMKWQKFFATVLQLHENNVRDNDALNLLKEWKGVQTEDCKLLLELNLLPYLIPPKGRVLIEKRKHWKFSILEVLESIIIHVIAPGDIDKAISSQKEKAYQRKQTVQPYILIQGSSLVDINCIYLVIDTLRYQFDSVSKAFDILFKLFHAFNAQYPVQSEYIYTLIQKCIYNIHTPYDKTTPTTELVVTTFLKDSET